MSIVQTPDWSGVLLLNEEEKVKVLYIKNFPSFLRRDVLTGASGQGGLEPVAWYLCPAAYFS